MEVQSQLLDFNFIPTGGRASPCSAAAGRFNFISAPASPSRASEFYREFDDFSEREFAFSVGNDHAGKAASVSAEELFDRGLIRSPMARQSNHRYNRAEPAFSLKSPLLTPVGSPKSDRRKSLLSSLTSKRKKHNLLKSSTHENTTGNKDRGRGWGPPPSTPAPRQRVARSLSPPRAPPTPLTVATPAKSSRRWKLTNFLLFRSASEGRAADKDPMRKLTSFHRRSLHDDPKTSATPKTTEINKSNNNVTSIRKGPPVSAHERHYTMNKAVSEDLKKKTFLPYKQGILGRLAVNPTVHALAHSFGSVPNN